MVELRSSALPYSPAKSSSCCVIATRNSPRWRARRARSLTHWPVARHATKCQASSITRNERPGGCCGTRASSFEVTCSAIRNIAAAATSERTLRVSKTTSGASAGTVVSRSTR